MAVVAKVSKESKKHQYLQQVYKSSDSKPPKKIKDSEKVEFKGQKKSVFFNKKMLKDLAVILVIGLISASGYLMVRFIQF